MIHNIQLNNFISHENTCLNFDKGVTVFVGHNGSGKSSVIDAITFALFGEHTRKTNRNLVHRGKVNSSVILNFSIGSRCYNAIRQVGAGGQSATAKLEHASSDNPSDNTILVTGERKQLGDSTSKVVAKLLGMDYKKLRVAAIVQQGELNRIIESQPKEFKELLNSLIGIDRLDLAYTTMHEVIVGFREKLRLACEGFDDNHIESVKRDLEIKKTELASTEQLLENLSKHKEKISGELSYFNSEIDRLEPLVRDERELWSTKENLKKYVIQKKDSISQEIYKLESIISEARNAFDTMSEKEGTIMNVLMVRTELEEIETKISINEGESGRLKGLLECSSKLQIKNGRCPLCNSVVSETSNEHFFLNRSHTEKELKKKENEGQQLQKERLVLKKEDLALESKSKKIADAEKFLLINNISDAEQIADLEADIYKKKADLMKLTNINGEDSENFIVDEFSKSLGHKVKELEHRLRNFKIQDYNNARIEKDKLTKDMMLIHSKLGSAEKTIEQITDAKNKLERVLPQLEYASAFIASLENIRSKVFNRDGFVGSSLRSWALKVISTKASDYIAMFNMGISRIELSEKVREIKVNCYGRYGEVDIDALSGGEKVAVALALRLSIANLMGSNKLDFIILDEPTTHLDHERKKSLVKILSEAFRNGVGPLSQIIIITHDAEIFEDSEVDKIYRFAMTAQGTVTSTG